MTPDQTADLYNRAVRIFGVTHGEIRWPYEANGLNPALRRIDPERFQRELAASKHRKYMSSGLDLALARGWVTEDDSGELRPGASKPGA